MTILSCDFVRSGPLDPEDWHDVGARYRACVSEVVPQVRHIRVSLAWALAQQGAPRDALALAAPCMENWVGGGLPRLIQARAVVAEIKVLAGDTEGALADLDGICAAPGDNPIRLAAVLLDRAKVNSALGNDRQAEEDLRAAMALAGDRGARMWERRAASLLERQKQHR